jgi:hypothetical protein
LIPKIFGAVAQLGERVVRNDEVVGSIPISSSLRTSLKDRSIRRYARRAMLIDEEAKQNK